MPEVSLSFRAVCGCFHFVFVAFMARKARKKAAMHILTLRLRHRSTGVLVGVLLTLLFFGDLLHRCGDVEKNPGPGPNKEGRQTRLTSMSTVTSKNSDKDNASATPPRQANSAEPTLIDIMDTLNRMSNKFDAMSSDVRELKDVCIGLGRDIASLQEEVTDLRQENAALQRENDSLRERMEAVEKRSDDFEDRLKRNNLIIYGIPRDSHEKTWQDCEDIVREMIVDKLELSGESTFERVHRLSAKKDSPIIAMCTHYKDKVNILNARRKLKGSDIFIGEDFCKRVREIRKKLGTHLKAAKLAGKRVTMTYDHLVIEGVKFILDKDDNLVKMK